MGQRGELFSTRVSLQNRTYFFNIKENRMGDLYLNIVESKNRDEGGFDRQSIILFAEDLQEFLSGFDESLRILEKEARERRRSPRKSEGEFRNDRSRKNERNDKYNDKKQPYSNKMRNERFDRKERKVVVRRSRPQGKEY